MSRKKAVSGMAKRALLCVLMLCACGLLCGCGEVITERPEETADPSAIPAAAEVPLEDGIQVTETEEILYFLNEDGSRLVPVVRTFVAAGRNARLNALISAELNGPLDGERGAYWPETDGKAFTLTVSDQYAEVDLPSSYRALDPEALYAVRRAVAETLCSAGMSHVLVLVGGREEGVDLAGTMPAGTFGRTSDLDIESAYAELEDQRTAQEAFTGSAAVYLPTVDGRLLYPTVRSVTCESASRLPCLYALLEEMGRDMQLALLADRVPAPLDYVEESPDIVRTEDGAYLVIRLTFQEELREALAEDGISLYVYAGMLTDTLMGFVPGVDGVEILIGGSRIREFKAEDTPDGSALTVCDEPLTRSLFASLLAAPVTLYVRGYDEDKLSEKRVLIPASENGARAILEELIRLPASESALPSGMTAEDILAVRLEQENAVLNLSENTFSLLQEMQTRDAALAVYAIVNTLTEAGGERGAVFFFDGQQKDGFADGIVLRGRLLRNPGIVE